jgi:anti-anti-sigma factor
MEQRIAVKGELDLAAAPDLLRRLDAAIEADPGGDVVVDLRSATFIDSTGLGVLVACRHRSVTAGGTLTVVHLAPNVRRVFEATGLDRVMFQACDI